MKYNMGNTDRIMRFVIGITIMVVGAGFGSVLGWIGVIPILTATIAWCPAYVPFGMTSCKNNSCD
ncbi:MAG: hypothetical protein ISEC1_P1256 [Thiomicrorhabdus sp.]|nr:MAG: hypothetical protein ISEC1_P1256 [Thiomicrorhabdus sp.]